MQKLIKEKSHLKVYFIMLLIMIFVSIQYVLSVQEDMQIICLSLSLIWTKDQCSEGFLWTPNSTCTSSSDGKSGTRTHWLAPSLHQPAEGAHRLLGVTCVRPPISLLLLDRGCWAAMPRTPLPPGYSPTDFPVSPEDSSHTALLPCFWATKFLWDSAHPSSDACSELPADE